MCVWCGVSGIIVRIICIIQRLNGLKKHLHAVFFARNPHDARLKWKGFIREFSKVKDEIGELAQKAIVLCSECDIEPIYNVDGTLAADEIKKEVFKIKSADLRQYMVDALKKSGKTQKQIKNHLGNYMAHHYFSESQWLLPTAEQYAKLQEILPDMTKPYSELRESLQSLQSLESLKSLKILERLQSMERLQRLQRLDVFRKDYRDISIPDGATVYCDPPYKGTIGYDTDFDHEEFYEWLRSVDFPVYVSEYAMPDDFVEVDSIGKLCTFSATKSSKRVERLFIHSRWVDRIVRQGRQTRLFE